MRRLVLPLVFAALCLVSCRSDNSRSSQKIQVVATIFPVYDFARAVGGDRAEVTLLLPPGMEAHSFEPRPQDMLRLQKADIFIYANQAMEPWAQALLQGGGGKGVLAIEASQGIPLRSGAGDPHSHGGKGAASDPHVWLDPDYAQRMVENVRDAFISRDPANAAFYRRNAAGYNALLAGLDRRYRDELIPCRSRVLLHGGHFALGYLAARYRLEYLAAFPPGGDAEPSGRHLAELVRTIRGKGVKYVFYEEMVSPRTAEALARETGASLLMLNAAHTVSAEELSRGVTLPEIMRRNLETLKVGLECR